MRTRRFDEGALRIDQVKLCFQLAKDGIPQVSKAQMEELNSLTPLIHLSSSLETSVELIHFSPHRVFLYINTPQAIV